MKAVYMVLRHGRDVQPYMVEILRVCSTHAEAMRVRQEVYDTHKIEAVVQCFMVQEPEAK